LPLRLRDSRAAGVGLEGHQHIAAVHDTVPFMVTDNGTPVEVRDGVRP
jgi:hypothetical protein